MMMLYNYHVCLSTICLLCVPPPSYPPATTCISKGVNWCLSCYKVSDHLTDIITYCHTQSPCLLLLVSWTNKADPLVATACLTVGWC